MSKTAKLLVVSVAFVVCLFLTTTFVSAGILDFFTGTQDELVSGNAVRVQEKVTCVFSGGKKVAQSCSSIRGNCRGIGSCTAIVQGPWGARDQWKSSCGGYATTTMDRRNDKVKFNCAVEEKPSPVESKNVKEKVTCIFSGGKKVVQNCYSTAGKCRGIGSCTITVQGKKWGEKVEWKSSCGGYATTITDGRNEKIKFRCAVQETRPVEKPVEKEASTTISCAKELGQGYWCGTKTDWAKECRERGKVSQLKCGSGGYCVTCAVQEESNLVKKKPTTSKTPTTSTTQSNPDCLELIAGHNKPNANRINILFVKSKMSQNTKDTALSILGSGSTSGDSTFLNIEPFKSNLDKFNFWYIAKDYDIELKYADDLSKDIASDAAKICNFENPLFVILRANAQSGSYAVGLANQLGIISLYSFGSATKQTLVHESGHSIGGLIDEYVTSYAGTTGTPVVECDQQQTICTASYSNGHKVSFRNSPNVFYAKSREECLQNAPWKGMIGKGCGTSAVDCLTPEYYEEFSSNGYMRNDEPRIVLSKSEAAHEIDCFEGAGLLDKGAFRSTFNSIMRFNQISTSKFGPYNEYLVTQALNKYSGK